MVYSVHSFDLCSYSLEHLYDNRGDNDFVVSASPFIFWRVAFPWTRDSIMLCTWFTQPSSSEELCLQVIMPASSESRFSHSPPVQYPSTSNVRPSSRSAYPSFISFQDSVLLQLKWALRGFYDAFRWNIVISMVVGWAHSQINWIRFLNNNNNPIFSDAEIRASMYKSLLLNSLSLGSIYTFDLLLLPLVQDQQKWFHRNISWFYQVLWLLPVVGVAFYLNVGCSVKCNEAYLCLLCISSLTHLMFDRVHGAISSPNGLMPCSMALTQCNPWDTTGWWQRSPLLHTESWWFSRLLLCHLLCKTYHTSDGQVDSSSCAGSMREWLENLANGVLTRPDRYYCFEYVHGSMSSYLGSWPMSVAV